MVLAEAGEDNRDGAVVQVAQKLLAKKPTHGWECKFQEFLIISDFVRCTCKLD